jgi:hypothetical protein
MPDTPIVRLVERLSPNAIRSIRKCLSHSRESKNRLIVILDPFHWRAVEWQTTWQRLWSYASGDCRLI